MSWLILPLMLLLGWREWICRRQMVEFGQAPASWPRLVYDLCTLAAILCLLQPVVARTPERITNEVSLAIAVDVSASMASLSNGSSRMELAQLELLALLDGLPGARMALIPFAGEPVVQVPLTADHEAFRFFLAALEPGLVSAPGSAPEEAVALARQLLEGSSGQKAILLISDGERTLPIPAPDLGTDIPVYTLAPGGTVPAPVPGKKSNGQPAMSQPDPARLKTLAEATGGQFLEASTKGFAIDTLLLQWQQEAGDPTGSTRNWLLLALVLLLLRHALNNRALASRLLVSLSLLVLTSCHPDNQAADGDSLFQQALQLPPSLPSAELFLQAAPLLEGEQRVVALHNACSDALRGNRPELAVIACEQALQLRPGEVETVANLSIALHRREKLPPGAAPSGQPSEPSSSQKGEGLSATEARRIVKEIRVAPFTANSPAEGQAIEVHVENDW